MQGGLCTSDATRRSDLFLTEAVETVYNHLPQHSQFVMDAAVS